VYRNLYDHNFFADNYARAAAGSAANGSSQSAQR